MEEDKAEMPEENPETDKVSEEQIIEPSSIKAHSEVEVQGDRVATSPAPMEIDEASRPSSQEKIPETAQVSERQVSEPPMEVIDLSDI